jgi:hypothetical protein
MKRRRPITASSHRAHFPQENASAEGARTAFLFQWGGARLTIKFRARADDAQGVRHDKVTVMGRN